MLFDFLLFLIFSIIVPFAPVYLLLRRTDYVGYSLPISCISFQPVLLVLVSVFGYHWGPGTVPSLVVRGLCLCGLAGTVVVVGRHRVEIVRDLGSNWRSLAGIFGAGITSAIVAGPMMLSRGYYAWQNGEFTNYSLMAGVFTGELRNPQYFAFFNGEGNFRYGAPMFLGCLSALTGRTPLFLVEALSAFHKAAAVMAFVLMCEFLRKDHRLSARAVALASFGFAFSTILSFNHTMDFLSAQAVSASVVLLAFVFLTDAATAVRFWPVLTIHVLFVLITYGEALPFLLFIAFVILVECLCKRRHRPALAILIAFGAALLVNPLLTYQRARFLMNLRLSGNGFNPLGSAVAEPLFYIAGALGFRFPTRWAGAPTATQWHPSVWMTVAVCLALSTLVVGFITSSVRLRSFLFVFILAVILYAQAPNPLATPSSEYYRAYKTLACLDSFLFMGLALLLDNLFRSKPWSLPAARVCQITLLIGAGSFLIGNLCASVSGSAFAVRDGEVILESDALEAASVMRSDHLPGLILASDRPANMWTQILLPRSVHLLFGGKFQVVWAFGDPGVNPTPDELVTPQANGRRVPFDIFEGNILIPKLDGWGGGVNHSVDSKAFLQNVIPGLEVQESRELFSRPSYRIVRGALQETGDHKTAYWSADQTASDSVGGNNGTLMNGAGYAPGVLHDAFDLSGRDSYVKVNGKGMIAGPRTFAAWVFPRAASGGMPVFTSGPTGAADFIVITGTRLSVDHWGYPTYFCNLSVPQGTWSHIALSYDGSTIQLYVNGVAAQPIKGAMYNYGMDTVTIGGNIVGGTTSSVSFNGLIDEVHLFPRVLSAAEIKELARRK